MHFQQRRSAAALRSWMLWRVAQLRRSGTDGFHVKQGLFCEASTLAALEPVGPIAYQVLGLRKA